jgi:transcriptional regulator with XRE-family HTH domain
MEFKDRLKELRGQRNMSQAAIAEHLDMSKSTIGMYETGAITPSLEVLNMLADFFNVSIGYLLGEEDYSTYYLRPEVAQRAQEIYEDPELRILFDAKRDLSPEDLEIVVNMIKALKAKEGR